MTLQQFLEALEKRRGIKLTRQALLRYLRAGRVPGAVLGRDATGVRRAWHIPEAAVDVFKLLPRGNPKLRK